jgi:hypothetical protein
LRIAIVNELALELARIVARPELMEGDALKEVAQATVACVDSDRVSNFAYALPVAVVRSRPKPAHHTIHAGFWRAVPVKRKRRRME